MIGLAFVIIATTIVGSGCNSPKPGCGNKRDHKMRKKNVKRMAPTMSGSIGNSAYKIEI